MMAHALRLLLLASVAAAPGGSGHWMQFTIDRPGISVPHYTVNLHQEDGGGWYDPTRKDDESSRVPIHVGPATLAKAFAAKDHMANCETRTKHIANTGKKVLSYQDGDQGTSCTFNYSDSQEVNDAANTFQAIAATMQAGERLAKLHRYDRLGLDAEIDSLIGEMKEGRALEAGNIAPTLVSIAEDERVMERVRRKAARMLQDAGVDAPAVNPR